MMKCYFKKICAIILLALGSGHFSMAETVDEYREYIFNNALVQGVVENPCTVAVAVFNRIVLPREKLQDLLASVPDRCQNVFMARSFTCNDMGGDAECGGDWLVETSWVKTVCRDKYFNMEIRLTGPKSGLTNTSPTGYEALIIQYLQFYSAENLLKKHFYIRRARYNLRSFSELSEQTHKDNIDMDPDDEGWRPLKEAIENAILEVSPLISNSLRIPDREQPVEEKEEVSCL